MFEKIRKLMEKYNGKKPIQLEEVSESDLNEFCENQDNQGEGVQLPCGE